MTICNITDGTPDVSSKEQVSICFPIVNEEDFDIQELFLGFYVIEITSSENIFAVIERCFNEDGIVAEQVPWPVL